MTDAEVFGIAKRHSLRPKARNVRKGNSFLNDLSPGSYVVHIEHGVSKFVGTSLMPSADSNHGEAGSSIEYWVLEYAGGDRLYVPMDQLERISPYTGAEDATPTLTRLGTQEWGRVVARARASTLKLAINLLDLYAKRELLAGNEHPVDTPWQAEWKMLSHALKRMISIAQSMK